MHKYAKSNDNQIKIGLMEFSENSIQMFYHVTIVTGLTT